VRRLDYLGRRIVSPVGLYPPKINSSCQFHSIEYYPDSNTCCNKCNQGYNSHCHNMLHPLKRIFAVLHSNRDRPHSKAHLRLGESVMPIQGALLGQGTPSGAPQPPSRLKSRPVVKNVVKPKARGASTGCKPSSLTGIPSMIVLPTAKMLRTLEKRSRWRRRESSIRLREELEQKHRSYVLSITETSERSPI